MPRVRVLIEIEKTQADAFEAHAAALSSSSESFRQNEEVAQDLAGLGLEVVGDYPPVPMFSEQTIKGPEHEPGFAEFSSPTTNADVPAASVVLSGELELDRLDAVRSRPGVKVYADSRLELLSARLNWAPFSAVDCRPFQPAVSVAEVRQALAVDAFFNAGFFGQGVVVGILDEGVSGAVYPVIGGLARAGALGPGQAPITSHGSMCAADVLVAAPAAMLYDYPFLGVPNSGGALAMFQAVLEQRRRDGTPHIATNSYGFTGVPPKEENPNHEIHDLNHPLHRKIREVVTSGAIVFFAAGNCGAECPSGKCFPSGIGPGLSIHGANSLAEVITVAAANVAGQRIGYSSQGPGLFEPQKPDVTAFSHFFGNFGPGQPGGTSRNPFDNGTSAACPVASGVAALLLSVFGPVPPAMMKSALMNGAWSSDGAGWNANTGRGIINAIGAYQKLLELNAGPSQVSAFLTPSAPAWQYV